MKHLLRVMVSLCLVIMLTACGSDSTSTNKASQPSNSSAPTSSPLKSEPSLEELAKKEGKVVFYTSTTKTEMDPVMNAFTKKYGIQVEHVLLRGNEMVERIKTESRTNKNTADMADSGPTTMNILKKEGFFVPFKTKASEKILGSDAEGTMRGTVLNVYGFLANTKLVSENEMPKTWKDLLDPKWKGKILSDDPRAAGGASTIFTVLYESNDYGKSYLENLAKQNITLTRQYLENEKALARGEYSIYIPALADSLHRVKGAPIKWIAPTDMTPYIHLSHGILKNAPHSNAANLFSDFIISDEAQKLIAETRVPANVDIEPSLPEMKIKGKKMVRPTDQQIDKVSSYYDEFGKIFK